MYKRTKIRTYQTNWAKGHKILQKATKLGRKPSLEVFIPPHRPTKSIELHILARYLKINKTQEQNGILV